MKAEHRAAVRRLASLCVVLSVASLSGGARAQAAPPAESATADAANSEDASKKEEAKERFLRGLELAQRDDWDAALADANGRFTRTIDGQQVRADDGVHLAPAGEARVARASAAAVMASVGRVAGVTAVVGAMAVEPCSA